MNKQCQHLVFKLLTVVLVVNAKLNGYPSWTGEDHFLLKNLTDHYTTPSPTLTYLKICSATEHWVLSLPSAVGIW